MRKNIKLAKKLAAVTMATALTVSLASCGESDDSATTADIASSTSAQETTQESTTLEPASIVEGVNIVSAYYSETRGIIVKVDKAFSGDVAALFKITCEDGSEINITKSAIEFQTTVILSVEGEFDLFKEYTVTYGTDVTAKLNLPSPYSTEAFEEEYTYEGDDLGANYTKEATTFKLWAPTATAVKVNIYESGDSANKDIIESIDMKLGEKGVYEVTKDGDLNGVYYTYTVSVDGSENETIDPYAKACGVSGIRGMVIDLDSTDPKGFDKDVNPNAGVKITDAIIYELHVRDISINEESGIKNKGKYLGLTEKGTKNKTGQSTGLDYLKDLGVNYVHIMPMYDYGSVDEKNPDSSYNWGYDPVNYNIPEGSYSTDSYNGAVRVKEAKQMVKALHDEGISVIMDVVYNHVYMASQFSFNKVVPDYFIRTDITGAKSNGSGCGNDVASERSMVRKYIVDSVKYWADEYHIDGFRFDLVGLIDTDTMNAIIEEVHKTHPDVIFYGEGWNLSTSPTKNDVKMATQGNSKLVPELSFFNDFFRDKIRGGNGGTDKGYTTGNASNSADLVKMLQGIASYSVEPTKTINYSCCHDNNTLFDKISMSNSSATIEEKAAMNKLTAAVLMTSQGTPFMMSGEEIMRTKAKENGGYDSNSYKSSDAINSIKWGTLSDSAYQNVYEYYKGLIEFRKAHAGLRMSTSEEVSENLTILENLPTNVVGCTIKEGANGEESKGLVMFYNGTSEDATVDLPEGEYDICVNGDKAGTKSLGTAKDSVVVKAGTAMVLVRK